MDVTKLKKLNKALNAIKAVTYGEMDTRKALYGYIAINALSAMTVDTWTDKQATSFINIYMKQIKKFTATKR
jgi:hypothetical protein